MSPLYRRIKKLHKLIDESCTDEVLVMVCGQSVNSILYLELMREQGISPFLWGVNASYF
jgi:hypothetical protein